MKVVRHRQRETKLQNRRNHYQLKESERYPKSNHQTYRRNSPRPQQSQAVQNQSEVYPKLGHSGWQRPIVGHCVQIAQPTGEGLDRALQQWDSHSGDQPDAQKGHLETRAKQYFRGRDKQG